jgi:formylglycine-generating enzyme required for sulfatase activity
MKAAFGDSQTISGGADMRDKILVPTVLLFSGSLCLAFCPSADLTGDCFIDFEDFALIADQWLTGNPNIPDDMVYIPHGGFAMGDHFAEGNPNELPVHAVLIDAFFMSKFEISNRQYCEYLNSALGSSIYVSDGVVRGSRSNQAYCNTHSTYGHYSQIDYSGRGFSVRTKDGRDMSDDPMVEVSWYGAAAYCNWRSSEEGYDSCYNLSTWECDFSRNGYRLPTEAEWEYAARGGNPDYRFPWGDTISHSRANYYAQPDSTPYDISPTSGFHPDWNDGIRPYTAPGGTFSANGYGLYDMAGNVWELCNDWFDGNYYDESPYDNPQGPVSGSYSYRVLRGGAWNHGAAWCRVAERDYINNSGERTDWVGFRVALDLNRRVSVVAW